MKSAYIITNQEMTAILRDHLKGKGFNTSGLTVRFTSTNAVVAGITPVTKEVYVYNEDEDDEDMDMEDDNDEKEDVLWSSVRDTVRDQLIAEPKTVEALCVATDLAKHIVVNALTDLNDVVSVAPARENGRTVSMYMVKDTPQYTQFVANETARIETRVAEVKDLVLSNVPKFYQYPGIRPEIVDQICSSLDEQASEDFRRDAKAVFYRLEEMGCLEHSSDRWKAAKTETDNISLTYLQSNLRETLVNATGSLTLSEIMEKIGNTDETLVTYVLERMSDVVQDYTLNTPTFGLET